MATGPTPFESPPSVEAFDSLFDEDLDPALRTPAFRANGRSDLEDESLGMSEEEILSLLGSYFDEAERARETGYEPRHQVWEDNLHSFWMRREFGDKRDWQSQEVSAMVPNFVERFAASQRMALMRSPDWAQVRDRNDPSGALSLFATDFTRTCLDFAGTNTSGQPVPFEFEFGNMCLTGTLMMMMASVTYDRINGRVVAEQVDPRNCYFDPTGRGLYRVRFWESDKETLLRMAELVDPVTGENIYDAEAIEGLVAHHDRRIQQAREDSSGEGQMLSSPRTPILIKEWLVDLIARPGSSLDTKKVRERQLIVTANDHTIIRGPEPNPNWHGKDWIVAHPILQAPLKSTTGRTYVELFRYDVETYENVLNRIIDMMSMASMNAMEVSPELLDDPNQLQQGVKPNQVFLRAEDAAPGEKAIAAIELGNMPQAEMLRIVEALRTQAQESGAQSDISLGRTTSGETTATEVAASQGGQATLSSSISIDIDMGFLGPIAELVYYTGLQHVDENSSGIWHALSDDHKKMLAARRAEFRAQPITVRANGLTRAVQRQQRLRGLIGALNVIGGNPMLMQEFLKANSIEKLMRLILSDFGVDMNEIKIDGEEKFMRDDKIRQQNAAAAVQGQAGGVPPGAGQQLAAALGGADPAGPGVPEGLSGETGR